MSAKPLGVGLLGLGTVGSAVGRAFADRSRRIDAAAGRPLRLVAAAVRDAGLVVGHDVALIGFDDIQASRFEQPPLTTVDSDAAGIGARAAELFMRPPDERGEHVELITPARLVIRRSCGCGDGAPAEGG